jgi:hypothetical protein
VVNYTLRLQPCPGNTVVQCCADYVDADFVYSIVKRIIAEAWNGGEQDAGRASLVQFVRAAGTRT